MSRSAVATFVLLLAAPTVAHAKACPNIMLVLDQSLSMAQDAAGNDPPVGPSKWKLLQDGVINVVKMYGGHVPFGLELFSTHQWHNDQRCFSETAITVELGHQSGGDIIAAIKAATPFADTNTGEAIKRAYIDTALAGDPARTRLIILVTDGNPDCNSGDTQTGTADYTVSEIANAAAKGIKTYVIGFDGSGVKPANLDSMASAGGVETHANCGSGKMPADPCYYRAGGSLTDFVAVLDKILRDAGSEVMDGQLCDDSCYTTPCPKGQICTTDETHMEPYCANDPCGGKTCTGDTFCRGGACIADCKSGCGATQKCADGVCVEDKCATKTCPAGQVCKPTDGSCIDFPCPDCPAGAVCDVTSALCVTDRCGIVTCPAGTTCTNNGNCVGGAGCNCAMGGRGGAGRLAWLVGAALAVALVRRRRA